MIVEMSDWREYVHFNFGNVSVFCIVCFCAFAGMCDSGGGGTDGVFESATEKMDRNPQSEVPVTHLGYPVHWETMSEIEKDEWLKWRIEK